MYYFNKFEFLALRFSCRKCKSKLNSALRQEVIKYGLLWNLTWKLLVYFVKAVC